MLHIKNFVFNSFREHCYLVWDDTLEGVIIDPGASSDYEKDTLFDEIESDKIKIRYVLLTHAHFDHIYGVKACAEKYGVEVLMDPAEKELIKVLSSMSNRFEMPNPDTSFATVDIKDGDLISFGESQFKVISTPGHSPGGVCFYDEADKVLFAG
ncbi:MAG: MBL fold metallo-hydrolase, partial [Bacteroidales bacterium]|nr:MBL fold metallo-hydrolase [Bacteroidales bacterium]